MRGQALKASTREAVVERGGTDSHTHHWARPGLRPDGSRLRRRSRPSAAAARALRRLRGPLVSEGVCRRRQSECGRHLRRGIRVQRLRHLRLGHQEHAAVRLGLGYDTGHWFRFDITGEYRGSAVFLANDKYPDPMAALRPTMAEAPTNTPPTSRPGSGCSTRISISAPGIASRPISAAASASPRST